MGYEVYEWNFSVMDVAKTSGGAPPVVDDDSGVLFAVTPGSADSPTLYTDRNGTSLTETNGVAKFTFSNGHVRFYSDRTLTGLDIYWMSKRGCGVLRNVGPETLHGLLVGHQGTHTWGIPLQGLGATAALAETTLGITPASGVMLKRVWGEVLTAATAASNHFDLGVLDSSTNGDLNGFLDSMSVSVVGLSPLSAIGVLSQFRFDGSNDIISVTPSASHTAGMIAWMEMQF